MSKQPRKTSKPSDSTGAGPRETGFNPIDVENQKNFPNPLSPNTSDKVFEPFSASLKLPVAATTLLHDPAEIVRVMAPLRLRHAIEAMRAGKTIEPTTSQWLADALEKSVANPAKCAEALGISRRRGRPETKIDYRHFQLALEVYTLHVRAGLVMKEKKVGDDALALITKIRNVSPRIVEYAWEEWRGFIEIWVADQSRDHPPLSEINS